MTDQLIGNLMSISAEGTFLLFLGLTYPRNLQLKFKEIFCRPTMLLTFSNNNQKPVILKYFKPTLILGKIFDILNIFSLYAIVENKSILYTQFFPE